MLKKIFVSIFFVFIILAGLYGYKYRQKQSAEQATAPQAESIFEDKIFHYQKDELPTECLLNSEMACSVEFAVKCTLNPDFADCRNSKLPRFIFMEDENLDRPTEISFQITKIKPISADLIEMHTDSTCNGNWFGLCQGRVIYVLVPDGQNWRVKDIYAIEK